MSTPSDLDSIRVFRCPHDRENPYVQINRNLLQNKKMTLEARGALCHLMSLPPTWQIYVQQLQEPWNCGRDKVLRIINELIENGYMKRETLRDDKGRIIVVGYCFAEYPKFIETNALTTCFEPQPGKPEEAKPEEVNPQLQKKYSLKKKNSREEGSAAAFPGLKANENALRQVLEDSRLLQRSDVLELSQIMAKEGISRETVLEALQLAILRHPSSFPAFILEASRKGWKRPSLDLQKTVETVDREKVECAIEEIFKVSGERIGLLKEDHLYLPRYGMRLMWNLPQKEFLREIATALGGIKRDIFIQILT